MSEGQRLPARCCDCLSALTRGRTQHPGPRPGRRAPRRARTGAEVTRSVASRRPMSSPCRVTPVRREIVAIPLLWGGVRPGGALTRNREIAPEDGPLPEGRRAVNYLSLNLTVRASGARPERRRTIPFVKRRRDGPAREVLGSVRLQEPRSTSRSTTWPRRHPTNEPNLTANADPENAKRREHRTSTVSPELTSRSSGHTRPQ